MPKQYSIKIGVQQQQASSIQGEARKPGVGRKKGWFHRFAIGVFAQRGKPGKWAIVEKFMTRVGFGDRYREKVTDYETGEVLRDCDDPLSQHQGHGSAKLKPN
jgi:hypothetical protein